MGTARKLESIRQELAPLVQQGKVAGFFNNSKNADKLNGLVEDIQDAMVDYQVCPQNYMSLTSNTHARHHCNKISMIRTVNSL